MSIDVLPVVEKCFSGIAETIRIFQTTQNMELPQKVSTILDSLPSQFQAITADLEAIKRKLSPLADGATSFSEADANVAFEFKEPPVLKEKALALRSQISEAASLENEIQSLKGTLSERSKVYLKQREVDGGLLKIERLQLSLNEMAASLELTKKEKLTVQADFEKEQTHFEEAMADFHKDIDKLEKENRRLKRLVKKGGIDSLGVNSPSPIAGSPATPSGGVGRSGGSVKVGQESDSVALRSALQTSVRRSLRWRQQAMKSELSFLQQPSQMGMFISRMKASEQVKRRKMWKWFDGR